MIMILRHFLLVPAIVFIMCVLPDCLNAADFNVNSLEDTVDVTVGDGVCADSDGKCTLRAAIMEANSTWGAEHIIYLPAGTYKLAIGSIENEENTKKAAASGDLDIMYNNVQIIGEDASSTIIDANGVGRALTIQYWGFLPKVTISRITITGGSEGGIGNNGALTISEGIITGNSAHSGGGIYNTGTLNIDKSIISNNTAGLGGGIFVAKINDKNGVVNITNSAIINNHATSLYAGGAFYNIGILNISNSTISGNTSKYAAPAIYNRGTLSVESSTIAGNVSESDNPYSSCGGGLYNDDSLQAVSTVHNTIIIDNVCINSDACYGTINSKGYNLINGLVGNGGVRCTIVAGDEQADIYDTNAGIGQLANNGGLTPTYAIAHNSPAIDAADPDNCPSTDQRGVGRPIGTGCDIGAFEFSCGDGVVQALALETCDDGNLVNGDGCSDTCRVEEKPPENKEEPKEEKPPVDEEQKGEDEPSGSGGTPKEKDGTESPSAPSAPAEEQRTESPAAGGCSLIRR